MAKTENPSEAIVDHHFSPDMLIFFLDLCEKLQRVWHDIIRCI